MNQKQVQAFTGNFEMNDIEKVNICMAALQEVLMIASEKDAWILPKRELYSSKEMLNMFHGAPPSGMELEFSIQSGVVRVTPTDLISIMTDVDEWVSAFSHIVFRGGSLKLTGGLENLSKYAPELRDIQMVDAEYYLPILFTPTWKFLFLRYYTKVSRDLWAIVDVAADYFHSRSPWSSLNLLGRRRPSGLVFRKYGDDSSKLIWIENVDARKWKSESNTYSSSINYNLAFGANRWFTALLQKLNRNVSKFVHRDIKINSQAEVDLQHLAHVMKTVYNDIIIGTPDENKWGHLSDQGLMIHWKRTMPHPDPSGPTTFHALTSFHLKEKPLTVFHYLREKNLQLEWHSSQKSMVPEDVIMLGTKDNNYCITIHKKEVGGYLLQEASSDEWCFFVISAPITQQDLYNTVLHRRWKDVVLNPSGFTIIPDDSGGLKVDSSLVTIALKAHFNLQNFYEDFQSMKKFFISVIGEIKAQFSRGKRPREEHLQL